MTWNWTAFIPFALLVFGIIGYLFNQNVMWMRQSLQRLEASQGLRAEQLGVMLARLETLERRVTALECRRRETEGAE
jgi:hypothetical protein